jgi:hypothetical protein
MFELNGKLYTLEQVNESARRSNLDVNEYIQRAGLKKVQDQKPEQQAEEQVEIVEPKPVEVEQAIKTRKALSEFSLTQDEILNNRKKYEQEAEKFFVTEDDFPIKQTAISGGIGSPGYISEKKVAPFDGYYDYVEKAKKSLNLEKATQEDVLNKAKSLYIEDRENQAFSEKLEDLALTGDLRGENTQRKLKRYTKAGAPVYETDQEVQDRFLQNQEEASLVLKDFFEEDLKEKKAVLEQYDNKINEIDETAQKLMTKYYYNQDELNKANSYLKILNKQKQALAKDYKKVYDDILEVAVNYQQNEQILDIVKRTYEPSKVFARKTVASTLDLTAGVLKVPEWLNTQINAEFAEMETPLFIKGTSYLAKQLKKGSTALRESVEKPIDIQDVNSVAELGSWAIDLVANQLPIVATLAAMPAAGLTVLGASAAGNKYADMLDEELYMGKDYNNFQLLMAPAIVGGAEYLSEKITLGQLNSIKKLARKNPSVLQTAKDYLNNKLTTLKVVQNVAEESGSEVAATLAENATDILLLQKPDVHIWDNVPNAAASGAFMSGVVFNSPVIGAKLLKPFIGEDVNAKLAGSRGIINEISKELAKDNLDSATRVQLELALKNVILEQNRILAKEFQFLDEDLGYDNYSDERVIELVNIDAQRESIEYKMREINSDEKLDSETKKILIDDLLVERSQALTRKKQIIDKAKTEANLKLNSPYKDLSEKEVEQKIKEDSAKAANFLEFFGFKDVSQVFLNGTDEVVRFLEDINAPASQIEEVKNEMPFGFQYQDVNTGKVYLISDVKTMKLGDKVNTAQHEFFHTVMLNTFLNSPEFVKKSGRQLLEYLNAYIAKNANVANTEFGITMRNYLARAAVGNITDAQAMFEVFTLLSDAFTRKTLSYNPGVLEKIGDFARRTLQRHGLVDIKFESPEDIFKFVVDFNENYKKGTFGKAFKKFAEKGDLVSPTAINPENVGNIGSFDASYNDLNRKVDALVGEKDANGNYTITKKEWDRRGISKAYEQIIIGDMLDGLILAGYQGPTIYGQPKENFVENIKYRKNGLADMLIKFDPEKNNSLIGWLNLQLKNRKLDVESEFRIKLQESPITAEMERTELATDEVQEDFMEVQQDMDRIENLIDASDIIGDTTPEFARKIKNIDLYGMYFKNVPNLVSETLALATGLAENKILNPADNLSTEEFKTGRKYIYDNIDVIMKIMPEANVSEQASIEFAGRSTGVPKSLLEFLYKKKTEKPGYNKADISKSEALAAFGINPDGSNVEDVGPRSKEAQRVKAAISLIGKLATNTKIRQYMKAQNMPIKNIVDIEAGKSRMMMDSSNLSDRDRILDNENLAVYKTLVLNDLELTEIYTAPRVDEVKALEVLRRDGLNEKQALDLHRSLLNYKPNENIVRLKSENRYIKSYRESFDYELYQKEAAIKEQLDLVGEDLDVNSEVMRGKILDEFIFPTVDKLLRSKNKGSQNVGAIIKFVYDNFYTLNNTKVKNSQGEITGTIKSENRISLFKDKEEFTLFINEILNKNNSPYSLRFDERNRLVLIKDTTASRVFAQQNFSKVSSDEGKTIFGVISAQGSFVQSKTERIGLDVYHNGKQDKRTILAAQNQETDKVRDIFKKFLIVLDDVKEVAFTKNSFKNSEAFDKKALASFMLLLGSKTHNYLNYLYSVEDISKNENVPDNITKEQAKRFYDFKSNIPLIDVMKFMTLYLSDTDVNLDSLEGMIKSLKGKFIPSKIKARNIRQDEKALKEKVIKEQQTIVEKAADERKKPLTKDEIAFKNLEDKLATLIAARDPKMPTGKILTKVEAQKIEKYYKPKAGTIISPDVADFYSLIQVFYRDGKIGEEDAKWFEDNLIRKFNEASLKLDTKRQQVSIEFKRVNKEHANVVNSLNDLSPFLGFTNDDALRVYLYYKAGYGDDLFLDENKAKKFVKYIESTDVTRLDDITLLQKYYEKIKKDTGNKPIQDYVIEIVNAAKTEEGAKEAEQVKKAKQFLDSERQKAISELRTNTLAAYAEDLISIYPGQGKWIEPRGNWQNRLLAEDVLYSVEKEIREEIFADWIANKDAIFSENNLNKILATYGKDYYRALVDSLRRMETGSTRPPQDTQAGRAVFSFLRGAIGVTMFFNARSAVLQTISTFNYIDLENNTIADVAKRISNKKQFYEDVVFLFQSDYLRQRRGGLRTDIQNQEIAESLEKGGLRGFYKLIMSKGFKLTQFGDSAAISFLGATYYRTRVIKHLADGKDQKQAEKDAFLDFYAKTEESQQSARPDRVSRQQTTIGGRLFLAYQNSLLQYNRIVFRDIKDVLAGRGNKSKKLARIAYYTTVQNFLFSAAQQAWFYFLFSDEEDKNEEALIFDERGYRLANSVLDTIIRGFGIWGGIGAAVKNTIIEGVRQAQKQEQGGVRRSEYVLINLLNASPIIGTKARQFISAYNNIVDSRDLYTEMGLDIYNPAFDALGAAGAFANIPLNRFIQKYRNVEQALSHQDLLIKNFLYFAGWSTYDFNYKDPKLEKTKERLKRVKKYKKSGSGVIINKSKSDSKTTKRERVKR